MGFGLGNSFGVRVGNGTDGWGWLPGWGRGGLTPRAVGFRPGPLLRGLVGEEEKNALTVE